MVTVIERARLQNGLAGGSVVGRNPLRYTDPFGLAARSEQTNVGTTSKSAVSPVQCTMAGCESRADGCYCDGEKVATKEEAHQVMARESYVKEMKRKILQFIIKFKAKGINIELLDIISEFKNMDKSTFSALLGVGGFGTGLNISSDFFSGFYYGDYRLNGSTENLNIVWNEISAKIMISEHGWGFTLGFGPSFPLGISPTHSGMSSVYLQNLIDWIKK